MAKETPPHVMAQRIKNAPEDAPIRKTLGAFDFEGITVPKPNKTFQNALTVHVGNKQVELMKVGPSHTHGDTLVHVPKDKVIFTGDILFSQMHPVVWSGPISNWIRAYDLILSLDVVTVVPGHGPIAGREDVARAKAYFQDIYEQASLCHQAGMSIVEAARNIKLEDQYSSWRNRERLIPNVAAVYREFDGVAEPPNNVQTMFALMAQW